MLRRSNQHLINPLFSSTALLLRRASKAKSPAKEKKKAALAKPPPQLARRIAPRIQHEGNDADEEDDKVHIGVLLPHNEGTWDVDDVRCNPEIYSSEQLKKEFSYETFTIRKQSANKQLRQITSEGRCDAFWNLCDGARDENRTGVDTVEILESLNVPFTGADSQGFEPSKIEMKMLLAAAGIKTPNFAVLDRSDIVESSATGATGVGAAGVGSSKEALMKGALIGESNKKSSSSTAVANKSKKYEGIIRACSHLRFPVIVKHISGYGSIGITKDSKCDTMPQLIKKVKKFVKEYDVALVEEFVIGEEGTVFVCADPTSPTGCHVFPPLMIPVPGGKDEFLHFDKKWKDLKALEEDEEHVEKTKASNKSRADAKKKLSDTSSTEGAQSPTSTSTPATNNSTGEESLVSSQHVDCYHFLEKGKPLTDKIEKMAANAFIHIMQGVGYGRCDFRIDHVTNEPLFLEINPNCGIFLPYEKTGLYEEGYGDFADLMIEQEWGHDKFIKDQLELAMKQQRARVPWWTHSYSSSAGSFLTKAIRNVPRLTRIFGDDVRPIPVVARTLFDATVKHKILSANSDYKVGCAVFRADMKTQNSVMLKHSCSPNCALVHSNTVELATVRSVSRGESLSIDYATLRDGDMPSFRCDCGADNCRGIVKAQAPRIRGDRQPVSGSGAVSDVKGASSAAVVNKNKISNDENDNDLMKSINSVTINDTTNTAASSSSLPTQQHHHAPPAAGAVSMTRKMMMKKRKKHLKMMKRGLVAAAAAATDNNNSDTTKTIVNGNDTSVESDTEAEGKSTEKK